MQTTLQASASRRTGPLRVVNTGRILPSRAEALQEAHASLAAAEENLRHLASSLSHPVASRRPALFHRVH